jgi:caffeoyl-CoA O-methyltransferase
LKIISQDIENYCDQYSLSDSKLLSDLIKSTWDSEDNPQMISGALVGGLLQLLIKISNAKNILEIGMFTGYSALKMAEALPKEGYIHTCEENREYIQTAKKWIKKSNFENKIIIHEGKAIETLSKFSLNSFDFCFIDADKVNYPNYLEKCLGLLQLGGLAVFDNMLWSGEVLSPIHDDAKALRETAILIKNNPNLEPLLLPIRDGIIIFRKIG